MEAERTTFFWIILVCLAPIAIGLLGAWITKLLHCSMQHDQPCMFMGLDISGLLGNMVLFHWLGVIALPIAAITGLIWIFKEIFVY